MGRSKPRRKNPLSAEGLRPGIILRMEMALHDRMEAFGTQIESVGEDSIAVLPPMKGLGTLKLTTGTQVQASYALGRKTYRFSTSVVGQSPSTGLLLLALPVLVEVCDRRRVFRLQSVLRPRTLYRLVIDPTRDDVAQEFEGSIVDLSEGGVCISTRTPAAAGERLGFQVDLPQAGLLTGRVRVTAVQPPEPPRRNWRLHCIFTGNSTANRDLIARYLMRRQLEMRRRGQL